jgi:hypothetical protein
MRIDTTTTDIHDLTDSEAVELRALCERMSRGPVSAEGLFLQWAEIVCPTHSTPMSLLQVAFLPRALYALLRREEAATAYLQEQLFATRIVTDDEP